MFKKYFIQTLVFLFEIIIFVGFFTFLTKFLRPFEDSFDIVSRFFSLFVLYEVMIYILSSNQFDAKKDPYNQILQTIDYYLLYMDTRDEEIINDLKRRISYLIDNKDSYFHLKQTFEHLVLLNGLFEEDLNNENIVRIKNIVLKLQLFYIHQIQTCELRWNTSLLLKIFK